MADSEQKDGTSNGNTENASVVCEKIRSLEEQNIRMQTEFNTQRAKLKDLFMQKEAENSKCQLELNSLQRELDELKSQFVLADYKSETELRLKELKAQEEISSLQQLVQDTIDESAVCKTELERISEENNRLWQDNRDLREKFQQVQPSESIGLAPQVLNQVKKKFSRKLGESSGSLGGSFSHENTEDAARSKGAGKQYAHEDAEVLRSIVVQLQEEMKALKEKLREADEKLQENTGVNKNHVEPATNQSTSTDFALPEEGECENCKDMIESLVAKTAQDQTNIESLQKNLTESREDLQKEATLRKDLEDQWQEKREAHKLEVQLLREQVKNNEQKLLETQQILLETKETVMRQLQRLTDDRDRVNKQLETLQADNEYLSGHYLATAQEIEEQYINLPNKVEELHEIILRQQNELIQARVGSEYEKKNNLTSLDEIQILRDQLETSNNERRLYKKKVQTEIKSLQDRLTEHLLTLQNYETTKNALERKEAELNKQMSALRVEIIELQEANEKLNKANTDYKAKIKNLQDDLVTSEQVQKDFVKLSQSLQMALENLRQADTEVRWQDEEDVENCPTCNTYFTVTVRKIHCRHCGHIYCEKCLTKTVPSGSRKKVARVCDICHTLLTPNTAPYFSREVHETT